MKRNPAKKIQWTISSDWSAHFVNLGNVASMDDDAKT